MLEGPELTSTPASTLGEFLFHLARKFSNRICHVDPKTEHYETYSGLNQRSTKLAIEMMKLGVTSQDVVVVCSTVTLDTPAPILASLYVGAKVANLDPSLSVRQTSHLLGLVSPKIIFVEDTSVSLIEKSLLEAKLTSRIVVFGESTKYVQFSSLEKTQINIEAFTPQPVDVEDTAIIFFSSGSSGLPKAICHSNRSFLLLTYSFYKSGGGFETILSFSSFYWISAVMFLILSFIEGSKRIFGGNLSTEQFFSCIQKYKVTYLFVAPIKTFDLTNFPKYENYDLSSVYIVLTGGTAISAAQLRRMRTVFAQSNVVYGYGLSEIGIVSIFDPNIHKDLMIQKTGSCGKVMFGYIVKIVDVETRRILGANQKGEICVKSSSAMKGYYRADSTSVFDDEGFFKTGDIGYYDDDECLYIVDRIKEMFKYLCWHIVPTAIEDVLYEHPAVKEAAVFGLPRSEEEGEVPAAAVVVKDNISVTEKEIEDFVAARVSDRERLRGGVYFLEELARTTTGKVLRRQIRYDVMQILKSK